MTKRQSNKTDFHKKLILFQYILRLFRADSIDKISQNLKDSFLEEFDLNTNHTKFYQVICNHLDMNRNEVFYDNGDEYISEAQLEKYDEHIVKFTQHISEKREYPIKWKYFQYLELLFTEIYLDKYFSNKIALLKSLNSFLKEFNSENLKNEIIGEYTEIDLNKLAFWAATGSGKTLLLHMNILQFREYLKEYNKQKEFNKIILLTPKEGLSKQHLKEFELSNINAQIFNKSTFESASTQLQLNTLHGTDTSFCVDIIEITKLTEEMGDKSIAVDSFETNNLVLVDEGHRGASSSNDRKWMTRRSKLSKNGFCFEYSATFGQAVCKDEELIQEYAKCILFDYSYKYFYDDGYGKQYQILNLSDDSDNERKFQYMTASLLSYFQQLLLYKNKSEEFKNFLIEKPLCVFIGASVNAVKTSNNRKVSDVVDILLFINGFISNKTESVEFLNNLISSKGGFLNSKGLDIFENKFTYLLKQEYTGESLYNDILKEVFNCESSGKTLYIENLKKIDGEIGLRLGNNSYFGVINVGDSDNLIKLCETNGLNTLSKDFSESLFHNINDKNSGINILIGSKKFSEGWNSWRVSTMGLMNMGRSEGAEVIQLFGRGVRLKGAKYTLKRSNYQNVIRRKPEFINFLETLNIFGVRANYMATFKEYLQEEGLPTGEVVEIVLPVISNLGNIKTALKVPRIKSGIDFKKDVQSFDLELPPEDFIKRPIVLDLYSKIEVDESKEIQNNSKTLVSKEENFLSNNMLQFVDYQELYFDIQKFKTERGYDNLSISFDRLLDIIRNSSWYRLLAPSEDIHFTDFRKVNKYQDIARCLLKKYCERFYNTKKNEWESNYREYVTIDENDPNYVSEYIFKIEDSKQDIIEKIRFLGRCIDKDEYRDIEFGDLKTVGWNNLLYSPMISFNSGKEIKLTPVQLNKGEIDFVQDLKIYYEKNNSYFRDKELYLLRNKSKGAGIGFFETNNFYPDFIMWLIKDKKQFVTFIDPKGLMHISGIDEPKIQFHKTIKQIEQEMEKTSIVLNSIILSNSRQEQLSAIKNGITKQEFNDNNVIFQQDENYIEQIFACIRE